MIQRNFDYCNLFKWVLTIFVLVIPVITSAQSFSGTYKDFENNKTYENGVFSMGYVNWGTEEEPEIVWLIQTETGENDEIKDMFWFSENAKWCFESSKSFLRDSDIALISNAYTLKPAGKDQDIIEIGTYGCNIDDDFIPQFILVRLFIPSGKPRANIWIPFNEETQREIYESLVNAIENIGIKQIQ